jgi:aspartate aminotransferase
MPELREAVSKLLKERGGLNYSANEILIACGARPVIYSIFRTLVDPNDTVIFAVPSWNNNHYTYLNGAKAVVIEASAEQNFMPEAKSIAPHIQQANLIALCSPQNPTGTVFSKEKLEEICDLILAENLRRGPDVKPVYLMYDQIYWALTHGNTKHYDPVSLRPEMKNYTVFVDGISKSLAATGVRVGWSMGPKKVIDKMKAILTHIGAWAPKAEQLATAKYLNDLTQYDAFLEVQKKNISARLEGFYKGFMQLKSEGFRVNAVAPQAAIYLTISFNLHGQKTADGKVLATTKDVTKYILDEAKVAVVPFYAFGADDNSKWYRLSVGTCKLEDVDGVISNLRAALKKLS